MYTPKKKKGFFDINRYVTFYTYMPQKEALATFSMQKNNWKVIQSVTYSIVHYLSWISLDDLCFTSINPLQKLIELWAFCTESLEYICQILTIFNIFAKYWLQLLYLPNINYICSSSSLSITVEVQVICTGVVITNHKTNGGTLARADRQ